MRAAIGINFVKIGDTERRFPLFEQGMADSPRAPPFFFLGHVVNALRMHDDEAAVTALLKLRPNFAANGRELIARGRLGVEVEAALYDGLAHAGLALR